MKNSSGNILVHQDQRFTPRAESVPFSQKDVDTSLPERFEKIVRLRPEAIAIQSADCALTYAQLNSRANQIARTLAITMGQRNKPVGLLVEKGASQVAGILGVLKSGNIFVPIDSSLPTHRIKTILDYSQSELLLTDRHNEPGGRALMRNNSRIIVLESISASVSDENLSWPMASRDPAYIIYTSGSTGQPKGVLKHHASQLHAVMRRTHSEGINTRDRIAFLPNGTANAIGNIFNALLNGATLLPFDVKKEGVSRLAEWLRTERISICQIASPLFRSLCAVLPDNQMFPELRVLRLRSESVFKPDVELYKKYFLSSCLMANGLSTSETGSICEFHLDHDTEIQGNEVPIGYPLEGMEVFLRDDEGKEVGFNEVGEIVVRSKYLAPGYWNQANLTKAKFKTDPTDPEKRLYYTGDLGLRLPDGCLVHKARKDFRIKIRGYGVDMVEVEKTLLTYPGIRQAIVVARQNNLGESVLVGYFASDMQPPPDMSDLQRFLKDKLAEYMIPSAFVALDSIPITPNGKIDRQSLPEPGRSRPSLNTMFTPPRNSVEEQIATIWTDVLSVDRVGIYDNFFELGGHSLAATRVASRVIKVFQLELPLEALFASPTVAEMALVITQNLTRNAENELLDHLLSGVEAISEEEAQQLLSSKDKNEKIQSG